MDQTMYVLPDGGGVTIASKAADRLIASGDGNAALLYIFILRNRGSITLSAAAEATGLTKPALESAMSALSGMGLVTAPAAAEIAPSAAKTGQAAVSGVHPAPIKRSETPEYQSSDISEKLIDSAFRQLVGEAQRKLGKVLSSSDLTILLGLYDYLGLPTEVIGLILTHCVSEARLRYGDGRMPTMRQIEKEAYIWSEKGIDTLEQATEYLRRISVLRTKSGQVAKILQISGRSLTASEQGYIQQWFDMDFGPSEIELAYDRTVLNTGSLKWGYMNSILKKWHEKGLRTVEDIKSGDKKQAAGHQNGKPGASEKSAIEMMKHYIEKKAD